MPTAAPSPYLISLGILASLSYFGIANAAKPVKFGVYTYQNKGPVAFGVIPSDFLDSTGDTIGGIGSAMAIKPGTWTSGSDGSFTGTLVLHVDSGPHGKLKAGYQTRQQEIDFVLKPYTGTANLNATNALKTLHLTLKQTDLQVDIDGAQLSGVDPGGIRPATSSLPALPIESPEKILLTIDAESLVADTDGSFWIGDEYGPNIYHFSSTNRLLSVIQPPRAFLPLDSSGDINFTSDVNPKTGRVVGQGFEGLTMDHTTRTLYGMLQSALVQDGGTDSTGAESDTTSRHTRLVAYDVSKPGETPTLAGEWIVPLPRSASKGKTRASSEILFMGNGVFLSLSRDGDGRGGNGDKSSYKLRMGPASSQIDLFSIANATNIAGSKFDDPANAVAPAGVLDAGVVSAEYISFVDMIDKSDLARLGLHNGAPNDWTLIASRWESLALAPLCDPAFQDDYFVFAGADNNFASTHGVAVGTPFDEGIDVDNQFLVYRVTLPTVVKGSVERSLSISPCFE